MPGVKVFLFTRSFSPCEIQLALTRRLIHHYEAKPASEMGTRPYWEALAQIVHQMITGQYAGNVQCPSDIPAREFLNLWVKSLPVGENTLVLDFDGSTIEARQILVEHNIFCRFAQAFMSGCLGEVMKRSMALIDRQTAREVEVSHNAT